LKLPPGLAVRKHRPKQLKLFERERPGDCVQVDVKLVRVGGRGLFQLHRDRRLQPLPGPAALPRLGTYSSLTLLA
jgi:hypothetical protein